MKTIFIKIVSWLFLAAGIALVVFLLNLNVVNRMERAVNRIDFESFINEQLERYLAKSKLSTENQIKADDPDMAVLQDYLMTVDPVLKRVPKERLKTAYDQTRALQKESTVKSGNALEWEGTLSDLGGRTRAIMWDPNDLSGNKVWSGGVTGGLWYKEDITNADSWLPVDDFWPNLAISCMTYDPNDPQTYFVGTGEAQTALIIYRESSGVGFGIMMSEDAGETWEVMEGTEDFEYVTDIAVRDEDGISVVYAAVASGIYKGSQHLSEPSDGLYRLEEGASDWVQVLPDIPGTDRPYTPSDIEIGADGRMYIGTMQNIDFEGGATILYSDAGTINTWTVNEDYKELIEAEPFFNLPGRVIMASAPSDASRVYALIAQGYWYGIPGYECHIILRSDNGGETWDFVSVPPNSGATGNWAFIAWHALTASVHPADPDRVFIGALDLWRSENAGATWTKRSNWTAPGAFNFIHADHHRILFQEGNSDRFLVATDGGVFYTDNAASTTLSFQEKNEGLNTLQMYKIALAPQAGNTLFLGGMQDNGTVYYDGTPVDNSKRISGGDGGACFIDQNEPDVLITSYQNNRFFVFAAGQLQSQINSFVSGNFISSVDYDYNLNTIYANAVSVTNQLKDSILRISGIPYGPYEGAFLNMNTGSQVPFTVVKYSKHSPAGMTHLFLGTQAGRMFKVENAQDEPTVMEIGANNFPAAAISCIALGRSEDTILVTFSNYGVPSVWQSYDQGSSWHVREGNLPDMPVRWALYHPESAKMAMLATELGVWTSSNVNSENVTWVPNNEGLANVRVDMLQLRESDHTVLAGTHGRGFYSTTFNYNPATAIAQHTTGDLILSPNPTFGKVGIQLSGSNQAQVSYELISSAGQQIRSGVALVSGQSFHIDISDLNRGTYFLRMNVLNKVYVEKILKY
jgi:hypothetical protein